MGPTSILRPLAAFLDRLDERRARRSRQSLGPSGRLLSWHRIDAGGWRARLSGPGWPETVERDGKTRRAAILRASSAFHSRVGLARGSAGTPAGNNPPRIANDTEGFSWP